MKRTISWLVFFLWACTAEAATIYIDGSMGADCTSGNYSIASRNCTGSAGNAYNDIAAALTASAANDTINIRTGSYTSNVGFTEGIIVKAGQTWQTYSGDMPSRATITAGATHLRVFQVDFVDDVTIRDLIIVGGKTFGIFIGSSDRTKIINTDVSGYNTNNDDYAHGIVYGDCCIGDSKTGHDGEITNNFIHSPGSANVLSAGVGLGGREVSNVLVANNRVEGTGMGLWIDVEGCTPQYGSTPCTIRDNYVKSVSNHCLHAEIGSTGHWIRNICDSPGQIGFLLRTGDTTYQNRQTRVQNNTFYNPGRGGSFGIGIWIQNDAATADVASLLVQNNIIYRSGGVDHHLLMVGELVVGVTTDRYQNNLFQAVGSTNGICWGSDSSQTGSACAGTPGTTYADTSAGISSWQAAAPSGVATGNIAGDPLFANPAGEDFRLCTASGVPHASCTGASPAINAGLDVGLAFNGFAPDIGALETSGGLAAPTNIKVSQY